MQKLVKTIICARHSVRMPMFDINNYTKYSIFYFNKSKITSFGKKLIMNEGERYRNIYESKGLLTDDIKIYSSTSDRNKKSVEYFLKGFYSDKLFYKNKIDYSDIFANYVSVDTETEKDKIIAELSDKAKEKLEKANYYVENIKLLEEIIGFSQSKYARKYNKEHFNIDNFNFEIVDKNIYLNGDIEIIAKIVDTLIYYHIYNKKFLCSLKDEDWVKLSELVDLHRELIFGNENLDKIMSYKLIEKLRYEFYSENKIVYFSMHDSNLLSLMRIFGFKEEKLPYSIYGSIPPNFDIVFEIYEDTKKEKTIKIKIIYLNYETYNKETRNGKNAKYEVFYPTLENHFTF